MPQFQFDHPFFQPPEVRETDQPAAYTRLQAGPRLVGGTRYENRPDLEAAHVQALALASLNGLEAARQVIFGWQRQGLSLALIYTRGIAPCARLLGEWWYADRIDFALTTIASTHLQRLLHEFSTEFLREEPCATQNLSLLLLTEPGAQHSLGLFMLGEFFRRAGWSVTLGIPPDVGEFQRMFRADWFDAIGVSVSTDRHLDTLEKLLPQLKATSVNLDMHIFVGGPMALLDPQCLNWHCAELVAEDAPGTVRRVSESLASRVV
jgi:methanogenic corrinoid protein MtbC1